MSLGITLLSATLRLKKQRFNSRAPNVDTKLAYENEIIVTTPEQNSEQTDEQINEQSDVQLRKQFSEDSNEYDLESGNKLAKFSKSTFSLDCEISKDQLDKLIKLDTIQKELRIDLEDDIFDGKPFETIYR